MTVFVADPRYRWRAGFARTGVGEWQWPGD
jgi:hypothetical protein